MGTRPLERLGHHGLGGDEISQPMLLDLRHLLPWPRVEDPRAAGGGLPQLARRLPSRAALLSPGQPGEEPLPRGARKPAIARRPIARLATIGVGRLPEPVA